jgi:carbon-monoxide dehydrogenase large subunit
MTKIGRSQLRFEDDHLLRGQGQYTDDISQSGDAILIFVRSPHAAAKIVNINLERANAISGVIAIFGWDEMRASNAGSFQPRARFPGPDGGAMRTPSFTPLADGVVRFCGEPILGIIATDRTSAELALEAVDIIFETNEAVVNVENALMDDAPCVWDIYPDNRCFCFEKGDAASIQKANADAAHLIKHQLRISRVTAAALEPRALRASFDNESGKYRLEVGTQTPNRIRPDLATALGIDPDAIEVIAQDCGGSFGMKNTAFPEYAVGLWACRKYGRSLRWRATRLESFLSDTHAREQSADVALGLDESGKILSLDVRITANLGANIGPSTIHPVVSNIGGIVGVYDIPASHVRVDGVFTNTQNMSPYRGAGRPEATYIIERVIDIAAQQLGFDKVELRRRNMIQPSQMPFETGLVFTYDSGNFPKVLETALDAADWIRFDARRALSKSRGKIRGLGIVNPIEIAGGPERKPHSEFARITVTPDGKVEVVSGSSDSGQGHATVFAQILSSQLGVDPASVSLIASDTRAAPHGTGTFGSRTVAAAGTSIVKCSESLIEKMRAAAADALDSTPEEVLFEDGCYKVSMSNRSISFDDLVRGNTGPILAEFNGSADNATFPNGCHVCEVEIDPTTGFVDVVSYLVVDDVGTVINPQLLKGQITGGVAQGLGQAMMEQVVYDSASGQLVSASFMDYAMPRATDLPPISVISEPVPTTSNLLGAKGAGEAGTVGALAAVMNAVCDALASVGAGPIDMPATPEAVWLALQLANRKEA